jgi:hypothetical protein
MPLIKKKKAFGAGRVIGTKSLRVGVKMMVTVFALN